MSPQLEPNMRIVIHGYHDIFLNRGLRTGRLRRISGNGALGCLQKTVMMGPDHEEGKGSGARAPPGSFPLDEFKFDTIVPEQFGRELPPILARKPAQKRGLALID